MNAKEFAESITGMEYPFRLTWGEKEEAKESGLVVVYGASVDLMEFEGAITDEISCFDGGTAYLTNEGLLMNQCEDNRCPYFAKLREKAATIEAIWSHTPYSWVYETEIPHETFEIMEEGEFYCKGIVFSLKDVKTA